MQNPSSIRWKPIDTILLALVIGTVAFLGYRVTNGLEYQWHWSVIPQYLFRYDAERGWVANLLVQGLLTTIRLSFWSLLLALPLGLLCGLLRISRQLFNRLLAGTYVTLLRNLPPLVLVFIFYYFISDQILPVLALGEHVQEAAPAVQQFCYWFLSGPDQIEQFIAAVSTLALFEAAYIAEIARAGINSIDDGQWQAASALGMRRRQVLRYVILPQALQRIIPPLTGQAISTIKDSAIVSVISIQELTFQGMELMAATYLTFEVWLTVTLLYFILTYSCSWLAARLEIKLRKAY